MYKNSKTNMESLINSDFLLGEKMNIDIKDIDISDLVSQKYMHKEIKKGLFLSDYQIEVLMKYDINPYDCSGIEDLIFRIDEVLNDDDTLDDLENVSLEISEFNYYSNTNK